MKYKYFGHPVPYAGKTIWEIIGNLKNFGVGRLIVADEHRNNFAEPTFYKIVKVQPLDTPDKIGHHRSVMVWAEYVLRGKKLRQVEKFIKESALTKYHLVPKEDEDKYFSGIKTTFNLEIIPKYHNWPPTFKIIWEQRKKKETGKAVALGPLKTVIDKGERSFEVLSEDDAVSPPCASKLFLTDKSVEELYKEIVLLQNELGIKDMEEEND